KCRAPRLGPVLSSAVLSRRHANGALECSGKRRRRLVACGGRNHEQFVVGSAQAFCGGIEPHASQVVKRGSAAQASDLAREGGPGQGYWMGKHLAGPGPSGVTVKEREGATDLLISDGRKPAGLRGSEPLLEIAADRADEQDVGEPAYHRLG